MSANQACFPVATVARVLGVSKAGYYACQRRLNSGSPANPVLLSSSRRVQYACGEQVKPGASQFHSGIHNAWIDRPPSAHAVADAALLKRVRTVHVTSRQTYGAPRVHAELQGCGEQHGRKRIARLMRQAGLVGASHRHGGPVTTRRDQEARPAPDLVDRKFTAAAPNQLWVADITYVPTASGFLYLAVVLDAWSRKIVGWSMANHLRTELVLDAMEAAIGQRRPKDVIHHSDQGSQYTSVSFGKRCAEAGVRPSMGSVGDAYDNAMAESFFSTLEAELLSRSRFASQAEAKMACFSYIEGWYNPARLHSALGYRSPMAYEASMLTAEADA
jgi:putative transposase